MHELLQAAVKSPSNGSDDRESTAGDKSCLMYVDTENSSITMINRISPTDRRASFDKLVKDNVRSVVTYEVSPNFTPTKLQSGKIDLSQFNGKQHSKEYHAPFQRIPAPVPKVVVDENSIFFSE